MPTEPVSPKPIARPCAAAASVTSRAVRPVSAHAVRCSGSISMAFMSRRSITIPPSVTPWPRPLWPPLRTASSMPVSRARFDHVLHVGRIRHPDDDGRPAIDPTGDDGACLVVVRVVRRDEPAPDGGPQLRNGQGRRRRCRHEGLLGSRRRCAQRMMVRPLRLSRHQELIGRGTDEFRIPNGSQLAIPPPEKDR